MDVENVDLIMSQIRSVPPSPKASFPVSLRYDLRIWWLRSVHCVFSKSIRVTKAQIEAWVRMCKMQRDSSGAGGRWVTFPSYGHFIKNVTAFTGASRPVKWDERYNPPIPVTKGS